MTINLERFYKSVNPVYRPYLLDRTEVQVYYGGSSSGKSYSIAQKKVLETMLLPGNNTLTLREVDKDNRNSTFPETKKIIYNFSNYKKLWKINKTTSEITFLPNGNKMIFKGLNDPEALKSLTFDTGPLTTIHMEETSQSAFESYILLLTRLRGVSSVKKCIILSFNPVSVYSWLKSHFFDQDLYDDILKVHTTYKDNLFLTNEDKKRIEDLKRTNPSYYKIYGLGEWGVLEGLVFKRFTVENFDIKEHDFDDVYYGMDFGIRHPNVIVKVGIKGRALYIFDEFYRSEKATVEIIQDVEKEGFLSKSKLVIADSSRPDTIREWTNHGFNVHACKKGPGSVKAGLDFLMGFDILIHKDKCPNIAGEFRSYVWKQTKDGKVIDEPVKMNDDGIDSVRYATEPLWNSYGNISSVSADSFGF